MATTSVNEQPHNLSGLKFSNELVQFTLIHPPDDRKLWVSLLHKIASQCINIPFIRYSSAPDEQYCFCVDRQDESGVQAILHQTPFTKADIERVSGIGSLTLFPHKNNLQFINNILNIFSRHKFPVFSLATSISAVTINTAYTQLELIADKIQTVYPLPQNHAPFRQEFRLEQVFPETSKGVR